MEAMEGDQGEELQLPAPREGLSSATEGDASDDDEQCCRICRQGEEAGKLFCPCRCAGSIKWIHESCLRSWLTAQSRAPICELCSTSFSFLPVYAEHAPQRLTVVDWASALAHSSISVGSSLLRTGYATLLWGFLLPLLTVSAAQWLLGGSPRLPGRGAQPQLLPLTLKIFLGEFLSVAGIALIYVMSLIRNLIVALSGDAASVEAEEDTPVSSQTAWLPGDEAPPLPAESPLQESRPSRASFPPTPASTSPFSASGYREEALLPEDTVELDEDFWNVMGINGNPLRALFCMAMFLCANVGGIALFVALPFFFGRVVLELSLPRVTQHLWPLAASLSRDWALRSGGQANGVNSSGGQDQHLALAGLGLSQGDTGSSAEPFVHFKLPPPGQQLLLDGGALLCGYAAVFSLICILVPLALLLHASRGGGARGPEAMREVTEAAKAQLRAAAGQVGLAAAQTWSRVQVLGVMAIQLVLVPCYVGHLVVCLLCGPVLHMPQPVRAAMANANMPMALIMQLFIGYVHLWGVGFLEGCVADVLVPAVVREASSNFFIGAICSHRRIFGGSPGGLGSPVTAPHSAAIKLALVHVAFHTPLAYVLWHLPARMLDQLLGDALFPVHLVDRAAGESGVEAGSTDPLGFTSRRDLIVATGPFDSMGPSAGGSITGSSGDGQPFFIIEMLQLYILVLQCLRVLEASPGLARLIASGLRTALRSMGLQHLLAAERPTSNDGRRSAAEAQVEDGVQSQAADSPEPAEAPPLCRPWRQLLDPAFWQMVAVAALLVMLSWGVMVMILSLPLTVGRMLVRYILATQANRISDFLPLSLGVVVFSALILAVVKVNEALPAITARAQTLGAGRWAHVALCSISALAMTVVALILIPLGLGTLLLRLVLPLKAQSVYQVPMVFLVTDCWSLGLVLTKVIWRLVQTDVLLHGLHLEFVAAWTQAQGSMTNLFFDLRAHRRLWRGLVAPVLEVIVWHLLFPRTAAHTLLWCCVPEEQEYFRAFTLMFCYHFVLAVRMWYLAVPLLGSWLLNVRQRIFDEKYLVSTELQNYHPMVAPQAAPTPPVGEGQSA